MTVSFDHQRLTASVVTGDALMVVTFLNISLLFDTLRVYPRVTTQIKNDEVSFLQYYWIQDQGIHLLD